MIIGLRTQTCQCPEAGCEVRIKIETRLPMQRGLGGVMRPKQGGFTNVDCERSDACEAEGRNCVWAVGIMRSKNDPLGLNIAI
jgi:hypothetical protein